MIKQLKEFGLIEHWKNTEMDKVAKITTNDNSEAEFKGLTLSNLQVYLNIRYLIKDLYLLKAPFYIFLLLNSIAIMTFCVEVLIEKMDDKLKREKSVFTAFENSRNMKYQNKHYSAFVN